MDASVDLFIAILTGLAVIVPFIIMWLERRDKLKKTVYLIELIKTKDELTKLLEQMASEEKSPVLIQKLEKNLTEIDKEINTTKNRYQIAGFLVFSSLEVLIVFSWLAYYIVDHPNLARLHFLEGIFGAPPGRIILILIVVVSSFLLTFRASKWISLRDRIKNLWAYNLSMIGLLNISMLVSGTLWYFLLRVLDKPINLF